MAASHAVVTGLVCRRREQLRTGRVAWPPAEVAESLDQTLETPVQPPLHGLGSDAEQLRGLGVGQSLEATRSNGPQLGLQGEAALPLVRR
jgi:hypothetical protein